MKQFLLILFLAVSVVSFAQEEPTLRIELKKDSIGAEELVEVTFFIENASLNNFVPPSFEDFDEVYGPNQSSQMSILNGKMTQSASVTYRLRPATKGIFVIEPATLDTGEELLKTEHTKVTVLEEPTTPQRFNRTPTTPKSPGALQKKKKKRRIYKI